MSLTAVLINFASMAFLTASNAEMDVITAISTVGFPIVMCGALFWYMYDQSKKHKEEVSKLTDVIAKNTTAIERLCDKFDA